MAAKGKSHIFKSCWPKKNKIELGEEEAGKRDLSNWMKDLSPELKNTPLCQLAIPGSHNSFTYSIRKDTPVGPDEPEWMHKVAKLFGKLGKTVLYRWAKCQKTPCLDQLSLGIRYFDIRLSPYPSTGENISKTKQLCILHGLFGEDILKILADINTFLEQHEEEVVLLDFQHLYSFSQEDHSLLIDNLAKIFGEKLCPMTKDISSLTVNTMHKNGYKVIVVYPSKAGETEFLWPRQFCPNPWPNTMQLDELNTFHLLH